MTPRVQVVWYVLQDQSQWFPLLNWEPHVTVDGNDVMPELGDFFKLWAVWKAWRYAHKIAPAGANIKRGPDQTFSEAS